MPSMDEPAPLRLWKVAATSLAIFALLPVFFWWWDKAGEYDAQDARLGVEPPSVTARADAMWRNLYKDDGYGSACSSDRSAWACGVENVTVGPGGVLQLILQEEAYPGAGVLVYRLADSIEQDAILSRDVTAIAAVTPTGDSLSEAATA